VTAVDPPLTGMPVGVVMRLAETLISFEVTLMFWIGNSVEHEIDRLYNTKSLLAIGCVPIEHGTEPPWS